MKNIFLELFAYPFPSPSTLSKCKISDRRIAFNLARLLTCLCVLFGCCAEGFAQIAIQTRVSTDQNSPSTTVRSPAFSTSTTNELLLAFVATDNTSSTNTTVQGVTGAGLTWVLVNRTNKQSGSSEIWRAFAPAVLSGVTVTATLSQSVISSITVVSFTGVSTTGTNGAGAIGAVGSGSASKGAPAATLVTTQNGSLVVGVGNDFDNAISRTPLSGQSAIHQDLSSTGDTYWVQQVNASIPAKGTSVTLGDSAPNTDRYNLSICEVIPGGSSGVGTPQLTVSANSLAFGNVNVNTTSTRTLTLTSSGTAALKVNSATLTGSGFTISGVTFPVTLNPGQAVSLQVNYAPKVAGSASGSITLSSNSSTGSTTVSLNGTGISPQLTLSGSTLAFGNVALNATASQTLTLTSSGTAPLTVNSATLTGAGFKLSGGAFPVTLNPGQTASLQVSFAPTGGGSASGTITISSNSASGSTSVVNLTGTGVSSQLTVSASSVAFGNVVVNSTLSKTLTLTASGTNAITVNSATISGAGFKMSGAGLPTTLNPGQSLSLQVSFTPTVAASASGSITISSNASTGATTIVSLSGTGTAPQLTVSATTLAFGNVTLNTTSTQILTLSSSGTAPVTINSAALSGTGFTMSGAACPATLNPGQSLSLQVSFAPTVTGAVSGTITVSSNSTNGGTATVALSGTGANSSNPVLSLSSASLSFGNDPVGTATNQSLTLTSTGTSAVTVSGASITGAGFTFSGATFPVTLNPNIAITIRVQFDPAATGAASGKLTFTSNSSSGASSVVNLSGNGTAIQHQVTLSWSAPANSPMPVTDYNVYRATGTSTSYQLLSSSNSTGFLDPNVQANTVYSYYVTSVGETGTESSPSNQVSVTVPQ